MFPLLSCQSFPCLLVKTTILEFASFPSAAQFSGNRTGSLPRSGSGVTDSFLNGPADTRHPGYCEQVSWQPGGIEHGIPVPSFHHIVLGSLSSMKGNEVSEVRTLLPGFACVQRGRIPGVG